jgi:hypothetical protein
MNVSDRPQQSLPHDPLVCAMAESCAQVGRVGWATRTLSPCSLTFGIRGEESLRLSDRRLAELSQIEHFSYEHARPKAPVVYANDPCNPNPFNFSINADGSITASTC